MAKPVRLQLSRKKGFDLQAHSLSVNGLPAVNVARPTKWGNPWRVGKVRCSGASSDYAEEPVHDNATAVRFFAEMLTLDGRNYPAKEEIVAELTGKNLACWCKPGAACHADVLLDLANPLPEGKE